MTKLAEILKRIGEVAEFSDIEVSGPNAKGRFDNYPLHVASVWGDCEAIEVLVAAGASIDQKGEHGFTPLMEATAQGNIEACKLLVALGAAPVSNEYSQLPSDCAEVGGKTELAFWLRARGF